MSAASEKSTAERYAEIEAEAAKIAAQLPEAPPHAKCSLAALMQHTEGLTVIEYCADCESLLAVSAESESAWSVTCPCGRSNNAFRGL